MISLAFLLFAHTHVVNTIAPPEIRSASLTVAAIQFLPAPEIEQNTAKIIDYLKQCSECGIRVAVFQECAITGYDKEAITKATPDQLAQAEQKIADACRQFNVYAVVGTPYFKDGTLFNTVVVFNPEGKEIERYAKIQLVGGDDWAEPGNTLSIFAIDGIPSSIIICHDERYPELARLPVLAGARLVFYVSSESNVKAESKIGPYRAQIQARAVENNVYIVQANSPAMMSHGQSRIIAPDGNIIVEASMFQDELISAMLDMQKATAENAQKSFRCEALRAWWEEGMKKVVDRRTPACPAYTVSAEQFEQAFQEWVTFLKNAPMSLTLSSNPHDYTLNEPFQKIVAMGPPALPYIAGKMRIERGLVDPCMAIAYREITKMHFRKYEDLPSWWDSEYKQTESRFTELYQRWSEQIAGKPTKWKDLADENGNIYAKNIRGNAELKAYREFLSLGIPALPFAFDYLRSGKNEVMDAIDYWTNGRPDEEFQKATEKVAKKESYLAWWEKNKDYWLLPQFK
ncbi:MAG TPA: carbon-nitrogen hydrolase family protein [bacterium]|nr:carbon-nitrogen hydrolase family protein [bacterium]HQQ00189.1 carbon-nitrogen hydrolase family protein [bacterium]